MNPMKCVANSYTINSLLNNNCRPYSYYCTHSESYLFKIILLILNLTYSYSDSE